MSSKIRNFLTKFFRSWTRPTRVWKKTVRGKWHVAHGWAVGKFDPECTPHTWWQYTMSYKGVIPPGRPVICKTCQRMISNGEI